MASTLFKNEFLSLQQEGEFQMGLNFKLLKK